MNQQSALEAATQALRAAIPLAQADPARPVYHFCPPAQWMNDINGPLFHRGWYHIFYQHHPFSDMPMDEKLAHMHWGHARSRDLVNWEHLPIALAPSAERGEKSCWSGCATFDGAGRPLILYTAVFEDEMPFKRPFEQWLACGDDSLLVWNKSANPLLSISNQTELIGPEWRDPFVFHAGGKTYLILGAGAEAGVPLFEFGNQSLTDCAHVGALLNENVECPNFFPLNGRWVFLRSPFGPVKYSVGSFDPARPSFLPETEGIVDWGHYYGSNMLFDVRGRAILFGWIPGWHWELFRMGRGWNGCMSLPRILSVGAGNRLFQRPAPELEKLRVMEGHLRKVDFSVNNSSHVIDKSICDSSEFIIEFSTILAQECGVGLSFGGKSRFVIRYRRGCKRIEVADELIPLAGEYNKIKLHVFIDRSVIEVYVNDGEAVVSHMGNAAFGDFLLDIFADGSVRMESLDAWRLSPATFKDSLLSAGQC